MKTNKPARHNPKSKLPAQVRARKTRSPLIHIIKFFPAVLFFALSLSLPGSALPHLTHRSQPAVLSYSTSMSGSDLLAQTNVQRSGNGVAALAYNSQLTNAAQSKANDMVARNYWSHTTPTGEEPWVFITNAGYQYKTAGENLAYGFATSIDTITGWMNSPPHRQNLLNSAFMEVGFGFANSANYVNDGQQTVVVAMYGAPLNQPTAATPAAPVQNTPAPPQSTQPTQPAPSLQPKPTAPVHSTAPTTEPIQSTPTPVAPVVAPAQTKPQSLGIEKPAPVVPTTAHVSRVSRIQILTGGSARWSSSLLVFSIIGVGFFWLLERGRQIKHLVLAGEHFMLSHIHIDLAVVGFLFLGFSLLQTSGLVR